MSSSRHGSIWSIFADTADVSRRCEVPSPDEVPDAVAATATAESRKGRTVAVVDVSGVLVKGSPYWMDETSSTAIAALLRRVAADGSVDGVVLRIDSPGGMVSGTEELGEAVRTVAAKKPVVAFVDQLAASAAYWVASQADAIVANGKTSIVGSIGTYVALYDYSRAFESAGVEAVLLTSGGVKGAGVIGAPVSDEARAMYQSIVDATQQVFSAAVSKGRGLPIARVRELADGRVHNAEVAHGLGLIDEVGSFESALSRVVSAIAERAGATKTGKGKAMATDTTPASFEDLRACLPGADSDFLVSQLEARATLDQAQSAWMEEQNRRVAAAKAEADAARARAEEAEAKAATKPAGVPPLRETATDDDAPGDAIEEFDAAVAKAMKAGLARPAAVARVARTSRELYRSFLLATNSGAKVRRLLSEKFDA